MVGDLKYVKKAAVIGSGAFGTALSCVLAKKSKEVSVWHINAEEAQVVNRQRENTFFLKGAKLPSNITFTADAAECLRDAEIVLFVTPTQFFRSFLTRHAELLLREVFERGVPAVVCSKGIERNTLMFPLQIVESMFPGYRVAVLSGPSFAIEVARGKLTNVDIAHKDIRQAREVQRIMSTPDGRFRCLATTDTVGCEVASAMKNVLAISSGVLKGAGMGLDARAALIARGLLEIRDLTLALGGTGEVIFGLAGLGDLLLTCSSELSRNFSVGFKLGQGETMEDIKRASTAVAEGVATADPLEQLAKKHGVMLPVCHAVYMALYKKQKPEVIVKEMLHLEMVDEDLPPIVKPSKL